MLKGPCFKPPTMMWTPVLVGVAILGPVGYTLSPKFRYFTKMTLYYLSMFLSATISSPLMVPYGRTPDNQIWVTRTLCALASWCGISFEFRGEEELDFDGPCVIVANHQSSLDVLGYFTMTPKNRVGMIKKVLLYFGPVGMANYFIGSVFIDRANNKAARNVMDDVAVEIKEKKLKLWVYAEGTRNHGPGMLPFKKGGFHVAVQAQIPIIPVVFSSYYPFYSKPERRFEHGGKVICQVMPRIETTGLTKDDVTRLSESTRDEMLKVFNKISPEAKARFLDA